MTALHHDPDALFRPRPDAQPEDQAIEAAIRCVHGFAARFNARDTAGMDEFLHFPHIILSGEELHVWTTSGQVSPTFFSGLVESGWRTSTYHRTDVILISPRKVHLLVAYSRDGENGVPLSFHTNLWIVTFEDARWGIKQRSY